MPGHDKKPPAERNCEQPDLRQKYGKLAIPAVVAALISDKSRSRDSASSQPGRSRADRDRR
jgi:hypothetical protein